MDLERRLAVILTVVAAVAIPVTALLIHLPHAQEIDYSILYLSLAALVVLVGVQNMILFYPSKHGKLFPRVPPFFIGIVIYYLIICVAVYFSGGLNSPIYYAALIGPIVAGISFELSAAMASTSILALLYLVMVFTHSSLSMESIQPLAFNVLYLYLACLLSNRLALELRRKEQSKDEVANLGEFIRRLEKAKSEFVSANHSVCTRLTSFFGSLEIPAGFQ